MVNGWKYAAFAILSTTYLASTISAKLNVKPYHYLTAPENADAEWYWKNHNDPQYGPDADFKYFIPNDDTQTCSGDVHATPFNRQVRGVNLGGWLVLEPWVTPTLFYQFLSTQERFGDQAPEKTAMDTHSFCTALGKEEANRQLRLHWKNWVTEEDFIKLHSYGIDSLRVPVGDWMFNPYEPYIGCTDGAIEELDRIMDLALKYDMDVLMDFHGHIGSQNGFDNSGKTAGLEWTSIASTLPVGTTTFEHWPIRVAEWAGTYDIENHNYSYINYDNLNHSVTAVTNAVIRYKDHPAILGLLPVNEPWELTPIDLLKQFYWKTYKRMKIHAPTWKFILHDSFRFGVQYWSTFMEGCPDIALDTHIYQAWMNPGTKPDVYSNACQQKYTITDMENALMPVIVGEWSLATDNCEMWLNGFNDNLPGFPKVECTYVECPLNSTYLGEGFPGTPLDINKPIQGPYGTGTSGPSFGKCPVTSQTAYGQTDDTEFAHTLNIKKLNAWAVGHGWYFWNFKTEIGTRWNFLKLAEAGVFPKNVSSYTPEDGVHTACDEEDSGDFICKTKKGVQPDELEGGLKWVCNLPTIDCSDLDTRFKTLEEKCDWAFNKFWHLQRFSGATCDFGGAAHLVAQPKVKPNTTISETNTTMSFEEEYSISSNQHNLFGFTIMVLLVVGTLVIFVVVKNHQKRRHYSPIRQQQQTV